MMLPLLTHTLAHTGMCINRANRMRLWWSEEWCRVSIQRKTKHHSHTKRCWSTALRVTYVYVFLCIFTVVSRSPLNCKFTPSFSLVHVAPQITSDNKTTKNGRKPNIIVILVLLTVGWPLNMNVFTTTKNYAFICTRYDCKRKYLRTMSTGHIKYLEPTRKFVKNGEQLKRTPKQYAHAVHVHTWRRS